jgi:hypothetical protein
MWVIESANGWIQLFGVWCGFTTIWWLFGIFGSDGARIVLKYQVGGWRAAYVQFVMAVVLATGIPWRAKLGWMKRAKR